MVRIEELGSSVEASVVERYEGELAQTGRQLGSLGAAQPRQLAVAHEPHVHQRSVDRQVVEVREDLLPVDVRRRHARTLEHLDTSRHVQLH